MFFNARFFSLVSWFELCAVNAQAPIFILYVWIHIYTQLYLHIHANIFYTYFDFLHTWYLTSCTLCIFVRFQAHLEQLSTQTIYGSLRLNSLAEKTCKSRCTPQISVTCGAGRNILSTEVLEVPRWGTFTSLFQTHQIVIQLQFWVSLMLNWEYVLLPHVQ